MKDSMRSKLVGLCRRLEEIDAMLAAPDAADDMNRFRALSQERAEIEPVTVKMHAYEQTEGDIEAAQEMANEDPSFPMPRRKKSRPARQNSRPSKKTSKCCSYPRTPTTAATSFGNPCGHRW